MGLSTDREPDSGVLGATGDAATKRLVFCFDGTTNTLDTRYSTNVVKLTQSLSPMAKGVAQLIYYDKGVGTDEGEKLKGSAFGFGMDKNLYEAYAFLTFNYSPGDEIYVFGFSRGAYTARSFVGLIYNCGVIRRRDAGMIKDAIGFYRSRDDRDHPESDRMREFRREHSPTVCVEAGEDDWRCRTDPGYKPGDAPLLHINYLGVWDTVGALGIPAYMALSALDRKKYEFHDTKLSRLVLSARHAVSIDERRLTFAPTPMSNIAALNLEAGAKPGDPKAPYQQQWFPGDHGSVGGGGDREGLSDQALAWIVNGARSAGLHVDSDPSSRIYEIVPDHREFLANVTAPANPSLKERLGGFFWNQAKTADRANGPMELHEVSISAKRRWLDLPENLEGSGPYRPATLGGVAAKLDLLNPADYGVGIPLAVQNDPEVYEFHEVKVGEDLGKLAGSFLGDPKRFMEIFDLNRDQLETPDDVAAGSKLRMPRRR